MRKPSKSTILIFSLAILVIGGGALLIVNGIIPLLNAGNEPEIQKIKESNTPYQDVIPVNMSQTDFKKNNPSIPYSFNQVQIKFITNDTYSVSNPITATVLLLPSVNSSIYSVYASFSPPTAKIPPNETDSQYQDLVDHHEEYHYIPLGYNSSTSIFGQKAKLEFYNVQQVSLSLTMKTKYGIETYLSPMLILTIEPPLTKLQAETDRNIQNQIAETTKANDVTTALTWILISAIPLGTAFEIIREIRK